MNNGRTIMVDDYREAYWWLRDNTPEGERASEQAFPIHFVSHDAPALPVHSSACVSDREGCVRANVSHPFNTGCLPLNYSGNPGVSTMTTCLTGRGALYGVYRPFV